MDAPLELIYADAAIAVRAAYSKSGPRTLLSWPPSGTLAVTMTLEGCIGEGLAIVAFGGAFGGVNSTALRIGYIALDLFAGDFYFAFGQAAVAAFVFLHEIGGFAAEFFALFL